MTTDFNRGKSFGVALLSRLAKLYLILQYWKEIFSTFSNESRIFEMTSDGFLNSHSVNRIRRLSAPCFLKTFKLLMFQSLFSMLIVWYLRLNSIVCCKIRRHCGPSKPSGNCFIKETFCPIKLFHLNKRENTISS